MTQPHMAEAQRVRDLIVTLGGLLGDVTSHQPAAEVHGVLLDRFDAPDHDSRIDGMEVGRREFIDVWTDLQHGFALPATAWEQVVLPTVVAFSNPQTQKAHLELATSHWLAARNAVDAVPGHRAIIAAAIASGLSATQPAVPDEPPARFIATPLRVASATAATGMTQVDSGQPRLRWARHVLVPVAGATVATVAALLLHKTVPGGEQDRPLVMATSMPSPHGSTGVMVNPSAKPSPLPTALPSSRLKLSSAITTLPTPSPVWSGPGPATPPSSPLALTAVAANEASVSLTWSAPAHSGTGGTAYYSIQRDGKASGWTRQTSVTITNLAPGTRYTFVVIAHNAAGQPSKPSNSVTVVTATPPPPVEPTASPSEPEPEPPSPSPEAIPPSSLGGQSRRRRLRAGARELPRHRGTTGRRVRRSATARTRDRSRWPVQGTQPRRCPWWLWP